MGSIILRVLLHIPSGPQESLCFMCCMKVDFSGELVGSSQNELVLAFGKVGWTLINLNCKRSTHR